LSGRGSVINAEIADANAALYAGFGDGFVHAVEASDKSGFAAAGGPNERGRTVREYGDVDVEQSLGLSVKRIQVFDGNSDAH
jgi:hypothetical protein